MHTDYLLNSNSNHNPYSSYYSAYIQSRELCRTKQYSRSAYNNCSD
jgi:hypothetical protein